MQGAQALQVVVTAQGLTPAQGLVAQGESAQGLQLLAAQGFCTAELMLLPAAVLVMFEPLAA